jgi:hypothetical protein
MECKRIQDEIDDELALWYEELDGETRDEPTSEGKESIGSKVLYRVEK